jgi:phosphopantetheinyl transferase (holo-ACP synthase)
MQRICERRPKSLCLWFRPEEMEGSTPGSQRKASSLAGRYACKIAVRSALNDRNIRSSLRSIVVSNDPLGRPLVRVLDLASEIPLWVSITHSREWAAAVAVVDAMGDSGEIN